MIIKQDQIHQLPNGNCSCPDYVYSEVGTDENGTHVYGIHEGRYIFWMYEDGGAHSVEFNPCADHHRTDDDGRLWDGYDNSDGTTCWLESIT